MSFPPATLSPEMLLETVVLFPLVLSPRISFPDRERKSKEMDVRVLFSPCKARELILFPELEAYLTFVAPLDSVMIFPVMVPAEFPAILIFVVPLVLVSIVLVRVLLLAKSIFEFPEFSRLFVSVRFESLLRVKSRA